MWLKLPFEKTRTFVGLTANTSPRPALERLAAQAGDITLDIRDLSLIDARSIGLLVRAATALLPPDRLVLRHPTGLVAKVFTLLNLSDHPRILIT